MSASLLSGDVLVWGRLALIRPGLLPRGDAIVSSIGGEDNFTGAAMHTPLPTWVKSREDDRDNMAPHVRFAPKADKPADVARGEPDQFAPPSGISLRVVSEKGVPSPEQLADRDRRYELRAQQSLTAAFFGDPPPGRSALDRRRAKQEQIARQSGA
jgi:hypothetical protein